MTGIFKRSGRRSYGQGVCGIAALWLLIGFLAVFPVAAETRVEIQGAEQMSEEEILGLMWERLVYVRLKPASASRANDAAFLTRQVLLDEGYLSVEVSARILGPEHILLTINEGLRLTLGNVRIVGDGDHERLTKLFSRPFGGRGFFGGENPPFQDENVDEGLAYVRQDLQAEGYWNAEVSLLERRIDPVTGLVEVALEVEQGQRFQIGRPTVTSSDGRGVKRVATTAEPYIGEWATTEQINSLRAAVVEAFTSRGYPDATILMNRTLVGNTYIPEISINLGVRVKLVDVHTEGLERTNPERIQQIMRPLKQAEWYDQAAMHEKIRDLLATGAFTSVQLETDEVARKRIDATLHFEEGRAKEVSVGGGFGSFSGPLLRAGYTDRNFRGMLRSFSIGGEISGRGLLGEVKLTDPWWRGTQISQTLRLYSLAFGFDGYRTVEAGLEAKWGYEVNENYNLELSLGLSYVSVTEDGLPERFLGFTEYSHARLAFTQTWDYRDSAVLPKSGWHVNVPIQIGIASGDRTSTYTRFAVDGGWYHSLGGNYQLGVGGFAQLVLPSGDIQDLPVDLRVFNGGPRSVRSFPERTLSPSFSGDPYGGDFAWAVNTEISRPIAGSLRAVGFVDVGGTTGNYVGLRQGGAEVAAGLGLRLDLPIGPVRLEYGHNLTQGPAEPSGTWHFAIGATF